MREIFQQAAEAVGATVKSFSCIEDAGDYLKELAGDGTISASDLPPNLLSGMAMNITGNAEPADATLCISTADAGIAATGSLLMDLKNPEGRAATALALKHAVFLDPSSIVPTLRDLGDRFRALLASEDQAYFSLTTGPSRTADIERVLTIGVHGPKELHILIVEGCCHE